MSHQMSELTIYEQEYAKLGIEMITNGYATVWRQNNKTYWGINSSEPSQEVVFEVNDDIIEYCEVNDITLMQIAGSWGPDQEFRRFLKETNQPTVNIEKPPSWSDLSRGLLGE